jgi:hypothetical protein
MGFKTITDAQVNRNSDFLIAGKILWSLFNVVLLALIILIFVNEKLVSAISLWLKENHEDSLPCLFCGMTRAFIEISKGNWQEANLLNINAIALGSILIINLVFFCIAFKTLITNR